MIRSAPLFVVVILAACSDQATTPTSESSTPVSVAAAVGTAITNVAVIDALGGQRDNQTVIFDGDEIIAVQDAGDDFSAAETIDGSGQYLIPGLWDFHVHLTYDDRLTAAMPELFLSWGITSVRDTGGLMHEILPVVESMRADEAIAPRVFFAGPLLDGRFVVYDGDGRPEIGVSVPTREAARQQVTQMKELGVDFIKVYEMVTPDVFDALIEVANELDLPIDSHVPLSMRARVAGAEVSSIEHLRNIELDCTDRAEEFLNRRLELLENIEGFAGARLRSSLHSMQRIPAIEAYDEAECNTVIAALNDTVMVPTLRLNSFILAPPWERDDWEEALSRLPADVEEDWTAQTERRRPAPTGDTTFADWSLFLTERMHNTGVPFGAGTDVPINLSIPGYSLHSELDMLVRAGLTPLEALEAATLVPAQYFGLEDEMGAIDVGQVADLVLLDANPLDDINNTKTISRVFSAGELVAEF